MPLHGAPTDNRCFRKLWGVNAGHGVEGRDRHAGAGIYLQCLLRHPVCADCGLDQLFPLWLRSQGLTEADVGLCLSLGSVLAIVANPIVGIIADKTGRRERLLIVLGSATALISLFNFMAEGFTVILAIYLSVRLFSSSLIPLSESIVLANMKRLDLNFGRIRSWGSSAVVALSPVLGILVDRTGPTAIIVVLSCAYAAQALAACALPVHREERARQPAPSAPMTKVLRVPGFGLLLGSAAISQACHGVFYTYSTFYWLAAGHSAMVIGLLWALGVTVEIVVFKFSHLVTRRFSWILIVAACGGGVLRWGLLGLSGELPMAILVQLLQGATLGLTQVGVAAYMSASMPPRILSTGTGLYTACTGLLAAVFIYGGGLLYPGFGGRLFLVSAALCAVALIPATILAVHIHRRLGARTDH
ncbi:MFS transporter [Microvirga aerilata]|uniref:MFS transporter n=1 Tax=Microvirga aerilata TaxID=670292 RepID=UPI0028AF2991|nr:MFS transporter [Microvirga aerilata]